MRSTRFLSIAALGLSVVACSQQQTTKASGSASSPQDLAYCAKLSQLYTRYVGADPGSSGLAGVTPDVVGGEAVAKCREGDARASIPTLERLLRDADVTLPPRS